MAVSHILASGKVVIPVSLKRFSGNFRDNASAVVRIGCVSPFQEQDPISQSTPAPLSMSMCASAQPRHLQHTQPSHWCWRPTYSSTVTMATTPPVRCLLFYFALETVRRRSTCSSWRSNSRRDVCTCAKASEAVQTWCLPSIG